MATYKVHITLVVSTTVDVEADSPEAAAETFGNAPDMPGRMVHGAFGSGSSVDEAGEWEAAAVMDATGNEVWPEQ